MEGGVSCECVCVMCVSVVCVVCVVCIKSVQLTLSCSRSIGLYCVFIDFVIVLCVSRLPLVVYADRT